MQPLDIKLDCFEWFNRVLVILLVLQLANANQLVLAADNFSKTEKIGKSAKPINLLAKPNLQLPNDTVIVRHFPGLNQGRVDGSVRVLLGESGNLNSGLTITSDLFVAGTPNININGTITYNGTVVGSGSSAPSGYSINVNSSVSLRHIVTKTDPIVIGSVSPPPQPQGNTNLSLNPGQTVSSFSNIRDITLNSNYGQLIVPEGTYGNFTANTNAGFTFGVDGENTTYNLQSLTLNSSAQLQVRGNVTINVANIFNLGTPSTLGDINNPIGLTLNVSGNNLNLNTNVKIYGVVQAPQANVNVNTGALLKGLLVCDRLNLNGGLIEPLVVDSISPVVSITSPTQNQVFNTSTVDVTGSFLDDSLVNLVTVNGVSATINGTNFTATVPITAGNNTITVTATDKLGNIGTASVNVIRNAEGNQPPIVDAGQDQQITLPTNNVTLNATVTDDGLPSPPAQVTLTWSAVSLPTNGTVSFSSPNSATTTATFNVAGTYVLQLEASDSILSASDMVSVVVNPQQQQNQAPVVSAGVDKSITLPTNSVTLDGSVSDDGLPSPPGQVTVSWSKISGSGTVVFSSVSNPITNATFSDAGSYVLRLTASDSALSSSDDVTVVVNAAQAGNDPPTVSAGQDQTITLPALATLQGQASDDGNPNPPGQLTLTWTRVDGPGVVNFTNPNGAITQASVTIAGTYTLRLTANDSALSSSDDVVVIFNAAANQPPTVSAGDDRTILLPASITLVAQASDDALPVGSNITVTWSKVTGPANVTFVEPNSLTTAAVFDASGVYVLRITASDGDLQSTDDITLNLTVRSRVIVYSNQDGFDADGAISTQAGEKVLMVRNRTNEDITYVFTQGSQSISLLTPKGKNAFINVSLVPATTATLTTVEHPEWSLTINVLP
jgi:hypothetical protein